MPSGLIMMKVCSTVIAASARLARVSRLSLVGRVVEGEGKQSAKQFQSIFNTSKYSSLSKL